MIIILEGCDGVGKTTLAAEIHRRLPFAWQLHQGPPQGDDPFSIYEEGLLAYDGTTPIICDRWHLGEMIYGPMYRGGSIVDDIARWHIEAFLQAKGATQIVLTLPDHVVERRLATRGDDMVDPAKVATIQQRYRDIVPDTNVFTAFFECDDHSGRCSCFIEGIDEMLHDARHAWLVAAKLRDFPTYVGPMRPDYLLLGERRNDEAFTAAFVPQSNTSGRYLLTHLLPMIRGTSKDIGIANACEEDVVALWHVLGQPKVVTLGNLSTDATLESITQHGGHRFDFGSAPHPQYVRRFHNKSGAQYARTIMSALETSEDLRSWRPA
jgi:hypothetical protein